MHSCRARNLELHQGMKNYPNFRHGDWVVLLAGEILGSLLLLKKYSSAWNFKTFITFFFVFLFAWAFTFSCLFFFLWCDISFGVFLNGIFFWFRFNCIFLGCILLSLVCFFRLLICRWPFLVWLRTFRLWIFEGEPILRQGEVFGNFFFLVRFWNPTRTRVNWFNVSKLRHQHPKNCHLCNLFQYFTYTSKLILGACFPLIGGNSSSYDDDELEQLKKMLSNR